MTPAARRQIRSHQDENRPTGSTRVVLRRRRCSEPVRARKARRGLGWKQVIPGLFVLAAAGPVWAIGEAIAERYHEEIAVVARQTRQHLDWVSVRRPEAAPSKPMVQAGAPAASHGGKGTFARAFASVWGSATGGSAAAKASVAANPTAHAAPAAPATHAWRPDMPGTASRPAFAAASRPQEKSAPAVAPAAINTGGAASAATVTPAFVPGTYTWTGVSAALTTSPDPNWTTAGNWSNGTTAVAPPTNGSATIEYTINPVVAAATNVNVNYSIAGLVFQGITGTIGATDTPSYNVTGSTGVALTIGAGGITDNSANAQTLTVPVVLGAAQTWNVSTAAGALAVNGVVSGAAGITKTGPGTLALGAANTYAGGTTLSAGVLDVRDGAALGTGPLTINGGSLTNHATDMNGDARDVILTNAVTLGGNFEHGASNGNLFLNGDVDLGGATRTFASSDVTGNPYQFLVSFGGAVSSATPGAGATFIQASGATDLFVFTGSKANTYTGLTNVNGASLSLEKDTGVIAVAGDLTVQGGGTVFTSNGGQLATTTNVVVNTGGTFDATGGQSVSANETVASLNGDSTGTVSVGNQFLRSTLTVGQGTMDGLIQDGFLQFPARGAGGRGAAPAAEGLTGGALVKNTAGVLTLTHNNTYSGGTTVTGGVLYVNNVPVGGVGSGTGSGAVSVLPSATGTWLGGTGQIAGDTTVGLVLPMKNAPPQFIVSTATLTPGVMGPGVLTFQANLTLTSSAAAEFDIAGTDPGTGYDQAKVGGNLSLAGSLVLTLGTGFMPTVGEKFFVFDLTGKAGTVAGAFENAGPGGTFTDAAGNEYTINYGDVDPADGDGVTNDVSLTLTTLAVPEPGTWVALVLGGGVAVAGGMRRRGRGRSRVSEV